MASKPTIYAENFVAERERHEAMKYGRVPHPLLAAKPHVYERHSIEPEYGHYSRPISGLL